MYSSLFIQAIISKARSVSTQILLDYRQKMYTYRFLTFLDNHFARKILSISFRNEDADTIQAKNQPKDSLICAGNKKPKLPSQ